MWLSNILNATLRVSLQKQQQWRWLPLMSLAVGAAAGRVRSVMFPPTCLAVVSHFVGLKTSRRKAPREEIHERATQASSSHYTTLREQRLLRLNSEWKWWGAGGMLCGGAGVVVVVDCGQSAAMGRRTWKNLGNEACPSTEVTSKLSRTLEDRMMILETTIGLKPPNLYVRHTHTHTHTHTHSYGEK